MFELGTTHSYTSQQAETERRRDSAHEHKRVIAVMGVIWCKSGRVSGIRNINIICITAFRRGGTVFVLHCFNTTCTYAGGQLTAVLMMGIKNE